MARPKVKAYIIPIDANGIAYLAVKALTSPYEKGSVYCPGCPTIFGGNVEPGQDVAETLYQEARQESHGKIDLNHLFIESALRPNGYVNSFRQVLDTKLGRQTMTFYALRGNFAFHEAPFMIPDILDQPAYKETTGDIVKVPLRGRKFQTPREAAEAAVGAMPPVLQSLISPQARADFYNSHSATALMEASHIV